MSRLRLRYENTQVLYAAQFVINASEEEFIINFSAGSLPEAESNEPYLPIHTRIALSPGGARKLVQLLSQALTAAAADEQHNKPPGGLHS